MEKVQKVQARARLISWGKGGRAQVVTYLGEGSQRRSVTRHVRQKDGRWLGNNPDETAIAYLDAMELAEKSSEGLTKKSSDYLAEIEGNIEALKADKAAIDVKKYRIIRRKFGNFHKEAIVMARLATAMSVDDKKVADKARAEIPRVVEFVF